MIGQKLPGGQVRHQNVSTNSKFVKLEC